MNKRIRVCLEDLREIAAAAGVEDEYLHNNDEIIYSTLNGQKNINEYSYDLIRPDFEADHEHAVVYLLSFSVINDKIQNVSVGRNGSVLAAIRKMEEIGLIEK